MHTIPIPIQASPNMKVSAKVKNQRKCNIEATFSNVLTMTGTSSSTSNPTFKYVAHWQCCGKI